MRASCYRPAGSTRPTAHGNCCAPRPCCRRDTATFNDAIGTLKDLALVTDEGDELRLSPAAQVLSPDDVAGFCDLLRRAVLGQAQNTGLDGSGDQTRTKDAGAKDLVRALAWFLTLDAFTPLGLDDVVQLQESAFPARLGNPIVNDVRWGLFVYWAPALGFAAQSLLDKDLGQATRPRLHRGGPPDGPGRLAEGRAHRRRRRDRPDHRRVARAPGRALFADARPACPGHRRGI